MGEKLSIFAVAPRVGAWIEILHILKVFYIHMSLPVWERGLKLPR